MCRPGSSSLEGSTKCEFCDPGRYASSKGASNCTSCPEQQYTAEPNSTKCLTCGTGKLSTGIKCMEAAIDSNLPTVKDVRFSVGADLHNNTMVLNYSKIQVHWKKYGIETDTYQVVRLDIETSSAVDFLVKKEISVQPNKDKNYVMMDLDASYLPFTMAKLYVRVRTVGMDGRHGEWSNPNPEWAIAIECGDSNYLDTSIFTNTSSDPMTWTCQKCPEGKKTMVVVVVVFVLDTYQYLVFMFSIKHCSYYF